jgi:Protein of unknown function (DUF3500)
MIATFHEGDAPMTRRRVLLALLIVLGLAGVAYVSQDTESAESKMTATAEKFLDSLTKEQKAKAAFAFDDKERTNWNFVPLQDKGKPTRKGLTIEEMNAEQKEMALALVKSGTSTDGYTKATTIMSLESILHELEKNGANVRNPGWYFFTLFGTPGKKGDWGWRVEGHHLSLNYTFKDGKLVATTPAVFGANPAKVMNGDAKKGLRTLPESEDTARDLYAALDDEQKKMATQPKQFPEIEQAKAKPTVGDPVGLPAGKMNEKQRGLLMRLLESYADRMPPEAAKRELAAVKEAGIEKVYFAFHRDDDKPGQPWTYRVQGPTFVIEFVDVQADSANNPANHIHSAWRNVKGDFGLATR